MSAEPLPDWFFPPPGGWTADDLDRLPPQAPRHIELIDGALIVRSPQTRFHSRVMHNLRHELAAAAPEGVSVDEEMTIKLGKRQRPEPDVVAYRDELDRKAGDRRTYYVPDEVVLAVEIVSDDSEERDRKTKPQKYAEAGIRHFWRVEEENGDPVVHVFELEGSPRTYVPIGIFRDRVKLEVPFPMDIDVKALAS